MQKGQKEVGLLNVVQLRLRNVITPSGACTREGSEIRVSAKGPWQHQDKINVIVPEYVWLRRRFLTVRQVGFWNNLPRAAEEEITCLVFNGSVAICERTTCQPKSLKDGIEFPGLFL